MSGARVLIIGALALVSVLAVTLAIYAIAPYLAAIIVASVGVWLWFIFGEDPKPIQTASKEQPRE